MSFAAGVYSRLYSWVADRDANIKILASRMDAEMDGFATGLSTCLLKDGSQTVTGNIPMATYKFTGLGAGTGAGESVRYEQVVLLSAGAAQTITQSTAGTLLTLESTDAGADAGPDLALHRNSASPAANDYGGRLLFMFDDSAGNADAFVAFRAQALDVTSATEDGLLEIGVVTAGAFAYEIGLIGSALYPLANDGLALGQSATAFADLFLASGAVINFNAGDVTITHSANTLTFAGASSGYVFDAALSIGTSAALTAGTIELGAASDTTLARASAGDVNIEGNRIYRAGGTDVAVADGGTGASTAAAGARALLDGLGTTKGNILWYNTSWTVLAPP